MILGVSADADISTIKQVAQRSLMELRLGGEEDPAAVRRIENALETLQDPVQRFHWGLFWPELTAGEAERFRTDPVLSTLADDQCQDAAAAYERIADSDSSDVRSHNIGVLVLLHAVAATEAAQKGTPDDIEDDLECVRIWQDAFRHLRLVIGSDKFWMRQKLRAKALGDARLDGARVTEIRAGFLAEILAPTGGVITTALLGGHAEVAKAYVDLLRTSGFDSKLIEETLSSVYKPLADRVERNIKLLKERLEELAGQSSDEERFLELVASFEEGASHDLDVMLDVGNLPGYAEEHARDTAAEFLRAVTLASWNSTGELKVSREANKLAELYADADSLRSRMRDDRAQLDEIELEAHADDVELEIRSDTIKITQSGISYNDQSIAAEDLDGFKCGVFVQYTNGVQSSCSYRVDYRSRQGTVLNIECKRVLRSKAKAEADFGAILHATLKLLAQRIVKRVAEDIVSGKSYDMGSGCILTREGVKFSTGVLMWKVEHLIPYREVRYGTQEGSLLLSSSRIEKAQIELSLRDHWNAVLFEHIAKAIVGTTLN